MRGSTRSGGGIRTSVLLRGRSGDPPPENLGISGAQRAHLTPYEASLPDSKGGQMHPPPLPLKEPLNGCH